MTLLGYKLVERAERASGQLMTSHDVVVDSDNGLVLKDRQGYLTKRPPVEKLEPKFQVGDKVQPAVGTVSHIVDNTGLVEVSWNRYRSYANYFSPLDLDLVERPKKEPKIGSVWQHCGNGETWVYIGNGRFYRANEPGIYTDRHNPDWAEVK